MEEHKCSICGKDYIEKALYNVITKEHIPVWYPLCCCEYNRNQKEMGK